MRHLYLYLQVRSSVCVAKIHTLSYSLWIPRLRHKCGVVVMWFVLFYDFYFYFFGQCLTLCFQGEKILGSISQPSKRKIGHAAVERKLDTGLSFGLMHCICISLDSLSDNSLPPVALHDHNPLLGSPVRVACLRRQVDVPNECQLQVDTLMRWTQPRGAPSTAQLSVGPASFCVVGVLLM